MGLCYKRRRSRFQSFVFFFKSDGNDYSEESCKDISKYADKYY